jgi:glycosyltransferase involved in cell wall biosynthesis
VARGVPRRSGGMSPRLATAVQDEAKVGPASRIRHDVAIYMPQAAGLYNREKRRAGGAERQTHLLARALAEAGLDVAHVVFPVQHRMPSPHPRLTVVERAPQGGRRLAEPRHVWQALAEADARTYVLRTATPALGITGLFCRRHGRRLIFSSANDGDFSFQTLARRGVPLYKLGVRLADATVLQSAQQLELARRAFPNIKQLVEIPSFVEADDQAAMPEPKAFLWSGRLVEYKQPLRFLDLAAAVPEARFRMLHVVHDAPTGIEESVRRRAAELPNVELLDRRSHAAAMELVRESVAVVNTSLFEGMPNTFLEAWARGVPVISLDCDPDERIVKHGLGIAAGGSWERFVAATRQMWGDRLNSSSYRDATRSYVAAVHAPEVVVEQWMRVIAPVS